MTKFNVGDKVRVVKNFSRWPKNYKIGEIHKITSINPKGEFYRINNESYGMEHYYFELVESAVKVEYEDQWHLNDGKTPIPEDAETVKSASGSVVAYRKVKEYEPKFGEMFLVDNLAVHYLSEYECVDNMLVAVCIGIGKAALKTKSGYDYTINFRGYGIKEYPKS